MRWLIGLMVILATLWGGYWVVGSRAVDRGVRDWFTAEQAAGRTARYDTLSVAGFPSRFDLTVNGLHLESPDGAIVWDAPFAQVFALTYKPWHVIAALPHMQTLGLPGEQVTLASSYLQGSLVVTPDMSAGLNRITAVGRDLVLTSDAGWSVLAAEVDFATKRDAANPLAHQIGLRVTDLAPDAGLMAGLAAKTDLPPVIGLVQADATVQFSAPLDRFAGDTRPQVTGVTLTDARLVWGGMILTGTGAVMADAKGFAEGRIAWSLTNWQQVPPALVAAGLIKPEVELTVTRMMEVLAAQSPDPQLMTLPLVFQSGRASLGPLPLGPAPRLNAGAGM